jgi:hypothetical protein
MSYFPNLEVQGRARGMHYLVVMQERGYRTGYVEVPRDNPLFGVRMGKRLDRLEVLDAAWGVKSDDIDTYVDAHGGISYTDDTVFDWQDRSWWIGFDCGHFNDGIDPTVSARARKWSDEFSRQAPVRSREYVIRECERIADQIAEVTPRNPMDDPAIAELYAALTAFSAARKASA